MIGQIILVTIKLAKLYVSSLHHNIYHDMYHNAKIIAWYIMHDIVVYNKNSRLLNLHSVLNNLFIFLRDKNTHFK